jgi:tRNA(fMet)-specific endonuclease VapC
VIVADSDVLIDFLRGAGEADRVALELKTGRLATTAITAFELWAGAKTTKQSGAVAVLFQAVEILPLTSASAKTAAGVRHSLENKKLPIGMADSLIAGICLEQEGTLLTRNWKHFERVEGLRLSGRYQ